MVRMESSGYTERRYGEAFKGCYVLFSPLLILFLLSSYSSSHPIPPPHPFPSFFSPSFSSPRFLSHLLQLLLPTNVYPRVNIKTYTPRESTRGPSRRPIHTPTQSAGVRDGQRWMIRHTTTVRIFHKITTSSIHSDSAVFSRPLTPDWRTVEVQNAQQTRLHRITIKTQRVV